MRRKKIGISSLLILSLLLQLIFIPVNASESSTPQPTYLRIFNGNTEETYTVLFLDNEVYFPAESYEKLTNYTLTSGNGTYGYRLGSKTIVINVQKREMQIPAQHYTGKIVNIITLDGTDYLPASELLPWMNVACNVHNGVLEIIPDGISMWEVIDDLSYSEHMFNICEEYGDSTSSIAGLSAMIAFDTIIHLRWDRLIPNDGTISGASKGNSLYDYKCYKSALVKIAENDPFSGEKVQQNIKSAIKVNKGLDTLSEVFGFDMDRAQVNIDNFIRESGMGDDIAEQVYAFTETWQFLRDGVRAYGQISKYLDIFTILKTYELTVETDEEYRTYLQWLSAQGTDNIMLDDAISDTIKTLDRNEGVIHAMFLQLGSALVEDLPGEIVEAIVNHSMNDVLIDAYNFYTDSIFTSLKTYMGIADFVYSTIIPISSGFEGAAKSGVVEAIQDYCWNLANGLQRQEMTAENIAHIRQSYLCALKASKINYEALQDLIDVKAFGKITIFDGEGLLNHKLSAIDEKILQLIASGDATENDSIEGKEHYQRNLRTMFAQLDTTQHSISDYEMLTACSWVFEGYRASSIWHFTFLDTGRYIATSETGWEPFEGLFTYQDEVLTLFFEDGELYSEFLYNSETKIFISTTLGMLVEQDYVDEYGVYHKPVYQPQTLIPENLYFTYYSKMTPQEIEDQLFKPAYDVYFWFTGRSFPGTTNENETQVINDKIYYKVIDGQFSKYSSTLSYAETYFSPDLLNEFISLGCVASIEDDLYVFTPGYGGPPSHLDNSSYQLVDYEEDKMLYRRCYKYPKDPWSDKPIEEMTDEDYNIIYNYYLLERIDYRWVFTAWELDTRPSI